MDKEPDRNPRKALGKGLSALLPRGAQTAPRLVESPPPDPEAPTDSSGVLRSLPLEQIQTGADQPREIFHDEKLQELAQSIRPTA